MYSSERDKKIRQHEEERIESERLALKKKDVRRNVQKYVRHHGRAKTKSSGGGKGVKGIISRSNKHAEKSAKTSARLELLLREDPGYIEAGGVERTFRYRQNDIVKALPVASQQQYFELRLEQLGPYGINYSHNGRHLLIAGYKGHIASMDWKDKRLGTEFNVREVVRDIQFLHNEMMYAVAQKRHVYVYDHSGMELHCLKNYNHVNCLDFLPYHFLLVSADDHGTLHYIDTSTGHPVTDIKTKLGALKCLAHNPTNAIVHLGHYNGCVSLWCPSLSSPLVKLQCHRGPITSLAIDHTGNYLVTAAMDAKMKVWDARTYKPLLTYSTQRPVPCMDISRRGLLAVGRGQQIEIWQDAFTQKRSKPYLTHRVNGEVCSLEFCPYEDCLGIGHALGVSSMIVPGAGEPNFDAMEVNPYQTKRQRQETEVKQLLDKIPAELIQLDPGCIGRVKTTATSDEHERNDEVKNNDRKKASGKTKALKKQKKKDDLARIKRRQLVHASSIETPVIEDEELTSDDDNIDREHTKYEHVLDRFK